MISYRDKRRWLFSAAHASRQKPVCDKQRQKDRATPRARMADCSDRSGNGKLGAIVDRGCRARSLWRPVDHLGGRRDARSAARLSKLVGSLGQLARKTCRWGGPPSQAVSAGTVMEQLTSKRCACPGDRNRGVEWLRDADWQASFEQVWFRRPRA